jgi:hypothetical protein
MSNQKHCVAEEESIIISRLRLRAQLLMIHLWERGVDIREPQVLGHS